MPTLEQLWSEYGLEPSVAFHVVRHKLSADIDAQDQAAQADVEALLKAQLRKPKVEDAMAVDGEVKEETPVEPAPVKAVKPAKAVKVRRDDTATAD